ncbi:PilN domain-containing protein [Aliikangiella coralliicola]|uniref:PilN domain-containing protein n=1 Tax=Aliikangiella coralliicola TaxID=2592383 RepID=A0A545UHK0_9GAMM|nr:PilN domain-containing protein [Aliikangiella coralliicola]TQV88947.1 PilN domain-containing protein [Aliikangiella coralliicola]
MANINLLPWREELRQEKQRQFLSILGLVAILGVAFMWAVYTYYSTQLDNQRQRNNYLQSEIRKLDSKIKEIQTLEKERQQLVERMNLIQDLQKSRPQVVHVFDEIVGTMPEGVNLASIERKDKDLILNGVAESGPRISKFMRNISTSKWLELGPLEEISGDKNSGANRKNFVLKTKISSPSQDEEVKQ